MAVLMLEKGHTIDVVVDGAAAIEAVRAGPYDLMLTDVQMPGVDGLEATRRIRRLLRAAARWGTARADRASPGSRRCDHARVG